MIAISRIAVRALEDENGDINGTPVDWWKRNKWACIWCVLCMMATLPLILLKYIVMIICFIPHAIYITLDDVKF
jgi:hypothetical protein